MTQIVAVNRLSSFERLPTEVMTHIFTFVPFTCLSRVSKTFRTANEESMRLEWEKRITVFTKEMLLDICRPALTELQEAFDQIEPPTDLTSEAYRDWEALRDELERYKPFGALSATGYQMDIHELDVLAKKVRKVPGISERIWWLFVRAIESCFDRSNLKNRAKRIDAPPGLSYSGRFKLLHEAEVDEVYEATGSRQAAARFPLPVDGTYSLGSFLRAESVVQNSIREANNNLIKMWVGRDDFPGRGLRHQLIQLNRPGAAQPRNAQEIRRWMQANQPALQSVRDLWLGGCDLTALPSEVMYLTNLQSLSLSRNRLRELPERLGTMRNIRSLYLSVNDITAIPDFATDREFMAGILESNWPLGLSGNPITTLSEHVYEFYYEWYGNGLMGWNFGSYPDWGINSPNKIALSTDRLQEMPFFMWLSDGALIHLTCTASCMEVFQRAPLNLWRALQNCNFCYAFGNLMLILVSTVGIVLSLPFLLYNAFMSLALIPLITNIRDCLGFGRMISINQVAEQLEAQ